MQWVTADLHLGHGNIIKYANRPFSDCREMDSVLVKNWNDTVDLQDVVFVLGDISMGNKNKSAERLISELNGYIILVRGNHDYKTNKLLEFGIDEVVDIIYDYDNVWMIHDPMSAPVDNRLCLCGHVHDAWKFKQPNEPMCRKDAITKRKGLTINVGVDVWGFKPISIEWLLERYHSGEFDEL